MFGWNSSAFVTRTIAVLGYIYIYACISLGSPSHTETLVVQQQQQQKHHHLPKQEVPSYGVDCSFPVHSKVSS